MRISSDKITELKKGQVFVFGSNEAGVHGLGAARFARFWGAEFGKGVGLMGQTYAIPTKDKKIEKLPLDKIKMYVAGFCAFAIKNPELDFLVTEVGCGLAGNKIEEIAPFFKDTIDLPNVFLPARFYNCIKTYD